MSVVRCEACEKYIDTDYDSEHFVDDTEICAPDSENPRLFTIYNGERIIVCDACPQTKTWLPNKEDGYWWEIIQCSMCRKLNNLLKD